MQASYARGPQGFPNSNLANSSSLCWNRITHLSSSSNQLISRFGCHGDLVSQFKLLPSFSLSLSLARSWVAALIEHRHLTLLPRSRPPFFATNRSSTRTPQASGLISLRLLLFSFALFVVCVGGRWGLLDCAAAVGEDLLASCAKYELFLWFSVLQLGFDWFSSPVYILLNSRRVCFVPRLQLLFVYSVISRHE